MPAFAAWPAALRRAAKAIARMDALVAQAKDAGLMSMLNARYREERMKARRQGRAYPSYVIVHKRFVRARIRIAAGQVPTRFDSRPGARHQQQWIKP